MGPLKLAQSSMDISPPPERLICNCMVMGLRLVSNWMPHKSKPFSVAVLEAIASSSVVSGLDKKPEIIGRC